MPLIACLEGPAETTLGSETYLFAKDAHGRFVAEVHSLKHVAILTGLAAYAEVARDPVVPAQGDTADVAELEHRLSVAGTEITARGNTITALQTENTTLTNKVADLTNKVTDLEEQLKRVTAENEDYKALFDSIDDAAKSDDTDSSETDTTETPASEAGNAKVEDLAGLGRTSAKKLATKGIETVAQLAALTPEAMAALDAELDLGGSSERNDWIGQAKALLAAPVTEPPQA